MSIRSQGKKIILSLKASKEQASCMCKGRVAIHAKFEKGKYVVALSRELASIWPSIGLI